MAPESLRFKIHKLRILAETLTHTHLRVYTHIYLCNIFTHMHISVDEISQLKFAL